ncbi:hypothetical protein [Thiocapsa roseopersicina]|uniref:Uncharacterized protein n=1 Tax=Thiocapsa roseopersicina TaxID=1058 RepID=A0A1H3DS58_THIRO|nr:hypothetical protein [Thiocapsa roseopersicina]SDX69201.1 hypothetical protein SAMN05421783_1575 [Thiocapsa roseopersicina]
MTDSTKAPRTTSAQRQAALRQRARSLAYGIDDEDIRSAPDTALLEALPVAFRNRQTAPIEAIAIELLLRLGRQVKIIPVEPSSVTVTPIDATSGASATRGYPIEVQQLAVDMAAQGRSSPEIHKAILAMVGRAPAVSNLSKAIRRWQSAPVAP